MRRWTRICCAVDGSDAARAALDHAAELARMDGSELHLVHVRAPDATAFPFAPPPSPRVVRQRQGWHVSAWLAPAARAGAGRVRAFERTGDAAAEIVAHAEEHGCDAIVLGARPRRGFRRLFFGSVAEWVLRAATCPVVAVPASPAGPVERAPAAGA